jgi:hypothetical protein
MTFGILDNPSIHRGRGSYANPHSTIAIKDIPVNIKQVMRLTRFYYNTDSLLGAIVDKMSEYPITEIVIKEKDILTEATRGKWDTMLNVTLDLRRVMIQMNVDKYVYGNSFWYLYYPFVRYCVCEKCKKRFPIGSFKDLRAKPSFNSRKKFELKVDAICPGCSEGTEKRTFTVEDRKSEARSGLTMVRMDPIRMELEYNPVTGMRRWYWNPPKRIRDGLMNGDRTIIDSTEMKVLEAVFHNHKILMNKERLWVAQADTQPGFWEGWGIPPIFRVLEDVYYYKILRRANEALAHEHVTPLRIISPAGTGDVSPQRTMNLTDWQNRIRNEMFKFKRDPNHILTSPLPLNVEQVWGQARVMMVSAEMEAAARTIGAGVGCPIEMILGGLNWSGASVSLRVLENHFLNDRENSERLLDFLVPKLSTYFRLPRIEASLAEFKMADDVQQQATAVNLMMQGFLSREDVLPDMGYDPTEAFDRLKKEHKQLNVITAEDNMSASHMNTIIQALEAKAGVLLQYELQALQQNIAAQSERERLQQLNAHVMALHQQGYTSPLEFDQSAMILQRLDPNLQGMILQNWSQTMPNVTMLLQQKIQGNMMNQQGQQAAMQSTQATTGQGAQQSGAASGETMQPGAAGPYSEGGNGGSAPQADGGQPLPEQRPPRRDNSPV